MPIKIQCASLNYFTVNITNESSLDELITKLTQLKEFSGVDNYLALDLSQLDYDNGYITKVNDITSAITKLGFKILFAKTKHVNELNNVYMVGHDFPSIQSINQASITFCTTKTINETVRSGAEIKHDGDVVVNGLISHSGEVKATGNIHVYGECRGKLFAGVDGDLNARIYVQKFNAETVGIGNVKYVFEDSQNKFTNKQVCIYLDEKQRINIIPMKS
jgi:septum site-determining protein MinC